MPTTASASPDQRREQPGDRALQEDRAAQVGGRAAGGGHHAQQAQLPPGTDGERRRRHDRHHQEGHAREHVEVADLGAAARRLSQSVKGTHWTPAASSAWGSAGLAADASSGSTPGSVTYARCPTAMCSAGGEAVTTMYPSLSAEACTRARDRHLPRQQQVDVVAHMGAGGVEHGVAHGGLAGLLGRLAVGDLEAALEHRVGEGRVADLDLS